MSKRLVAALAAIVLGVSTLAVTPAVAATPTGAVYVALGDSVASGNGILPYLDKECLRSKRSYPELLAKELGITVVSAACTEATTQGALSQVAYLFNSAALGSATELATLTVGVNNTAWQLALLVCSNAPIPDGFPFPGECDEALALVESMITQGLDDRIALVIQTIAGHAPGAQIVVTGYPVPFGAVTGTCHVGLLDAPHLGIRTPVSFDAAATAAINTMAASLNEAIQRGVATSGAANALYVDVNDDISDASGAVIAEGFDGHGLCDRDDRWMSGFLPATAETTDRGFHPNAAGHAAYANIIAAVIDG